MKYLKYAIEGILLLAAWAAFMLGIIGIYALVQAAGW